MRALHLRRLQTLRHAPGFTQIELLIAMAVVAVLAAIAIPFFNDAVRKSRRSEAIAALSGVQQAQERWRTNNSKYANDSQLTTTLPGGLGLSATTAGGYYGIAIDSPLAAAPAATDSTDYTVTATAMAGRSQAQDGACVRLRVRSSGGNIFYGSAPAGGSFDEAVGNRCWAR
jgi:type IV pilus assembly protein PilE